MVDKVQLIAQIVQSSGVKGKALEDLRTRLFSMSEEQLNAELLSLISGAKNSDASEADLKKSSIYSGEFATIDDSMGISLQRTTTQVPIQSPQKQRSQELTNEEIQNLSVQTIKEDILKALDIYLAQTNNQGSISDFYNNLKETFDTEFAGTRIHRVLSSEKLGSKLLQQTQNNNLTEKDYLEAKLNLATKLLPEIKSGETKGNVSKAIITLGLYNGFGGTTESEKERIIAEQQIVFLKKALSQLTPEQLNVFIDSMKSMSDEEFNKKAPKVAEKLVNDQIKIELKENKPQLKDSLSFNFKIPNLNSIESKLQSINSHKLLTFEETFQKERGVEYNSQAIEDYAQKNSQMEFLLGMHNKKTQVTNILHNATILVDGNNKNGVLNIRAIEPSAKHEEPTTKYLETSLIIVLKTLYGDDKAKINEVLKELSGNESIKLTKPQNGEFLNEQIDLGLFGNNNKSYSLVDISKKLQAKLDANFQNALGDKTLEQHEKELKISYNKAYGEKNAKQLADSFAQSQEEGIQGIKSTVQTAGMVVMVAGQVVPFAGQGLTTMIGMGISTLGSSGVQAIEHYTKSFNTPEEEAEAKKAMLQELTTSLALVGSGMGIGKGSESVFRNLVAKNCPKLLAFTSEVGIDATASLLADYAITGQIDLSGEGRAQLQMILTGLLKSKGNFKSYVNIHAGDIGRPQNIVTKWTDIEIETLRPLDANPLKKPKVQEVLFEKLARIERIKQETPELKYPEVECEAIDLHNRALEVQAEIVSAVKAAGLDNGSDFTSRAKGVSSLYDKVADSFTKKNDMQKAIAEVRDAVGTRTTLTEFDFKKHPDLLNLYKTDPSKALILANERYTQAYVDKIIEIINDPNRKITPTTISNYHGKDGIAYFSETQIDKIDRAAKLKGLEIEIKTGSRTERASGYTALQMNFKHQNGEVFEWQLRGQKVNEFAEYEHVPYDLREHKDISGRIPELKAFYKPFEKKIAEMTSDQYTKYNEYLTKYYQALRLEEMGFEATYPKFPAEFDPRLSAEGLEQVHLEANAIKKIHKTKLEEAGDTKATKVEAKPLTTEEIQTKYGGVNEFIIEKLIEYSKTDRNLIVALLEARDADGSVQFNISDIESLIQPSQVDKDFTLKLVEAKNADGSTRFDRYDIRSIIQSPHIDKDLTLKLLDAKSADGSAQFSIYDIRSIIQSSQIDKDLTLKLVDAKNADGSARFKRYDIGSLIQSSRTDKDLTLKLVEAKNADGSARFSSYEIGSLIQFSRTDKDLTLKLVDAKNADGSAKFTSYDIESLIQTSQIDKDLTLKLLDAKKADGSDKFASYDIGLIVQSSRIDKGLTLKLLDAKNADGSTKFNRYEIDSIIQSSQSGKDLTLQAIEAGNVIDCTGTEITKLVETIVKNKAEYEKLLNSYSNIKEYCKKNELVVLDDIPDASSFVENINEITVTDKNGKQYYATFDLDGHILKKEEVNTLSEPKIMYSKQIIGDKSENVIMKFNDDYSAMINSIKTIKDKKGNVLYKEYCVPSKDFPNKHNIYQSDAQGRKTLIGLVEKTPNGNMVIEKTLIANNGTKTDYTYLQEPSGNRLNYIKITDETGKVVLENRKKFTIINENHFISTENGQQYDIKYEADKVVVTKLNGKSTGKTVEITIANNGNSGILSAETLEITKLLPGSSYFDIAKYGLDEISMDSTHQDTTYYNYTNNNIFISKELNNKENLFVLLHELGHYKDFADGIHQNKELLNLFSVERNNFVENNSRLELEAEAYFTILDHPNLGGSITEVIAETNAFLNSSNTWDQIEARGVYLQKYFPKTFAKIAELLQQ